VLRKKLQLDVCTCYPDPKSPHCPQTTLIHKIRLRQRQALRWLRRAMHPIRLHAIRLRVNFHLRPHVVELHVPLADVSAILDGFDALAQAVGFDDTRGDGGLRHERDAGLRDERREHGAHDDGLDGRDRGVGIALCGVSDILQLTREIREGGRTIWAYEQNPLLTTSFGLTPKFAGFQSTRSATLPTSMLPIMWPIPWAIAGLIVYLLMYLLTLKLSAFVPSSSLSVPRWTLFLCAVFHVRRMTSPHRPIA
jgi:hypothetical protein